MRKLLMTAAVLAAGALALTTNANAGGSRNDWVCWMQPSGTTECAWLKKHHYHVHMMRPHRHGRNCDHCAVPGKLDHGKIHHFDDEGVNTATMRSYHDVTLYGDKERKNAHKHGH